MTSRHNVAPADYEELRIALVMNGGVSLVVWIGGVTHEINRAMRCESLYGELLDLTATAARVDVISGASAGGINGALLALALAYDTDLAQVRDVWLLRGSLDALLRSPFDSDPSSLLRGNERFFEDLRTAFTRVRGTGPIRPAADVPLDLTLTTTMLHGEPARITDDLGVLINDVSHSARFEFRRNERLHKDPFAEKDIAERLALASRASASFPVAFEPVFCPIKPDEPPKDGRLLDMSEVATFRKSRFLLDGGILDNKPLESALRAVFQQRANREVRRVLAYVVPAPGQTAVERADELGAAPTLGEVAMASLIELPRVESISAQIESIIEHNRLVRRKRDTRVALVRELKADGMRELAARLFTTYRKRRLESAADYIVEALSAELAKGEMPSSMLGRRRREWLTRVLLELPTVPWVPDSPPPANETFDDHALDQWAWGAFTIEHISEILFDLFRRALIVAPLYRSPDPELRTRLKSHYAAGYDLLAAMPRTRRDDQNFWAQRVQPLSAVMTAPSHEMATKARTWARDCLRGWSERKTTMTIGAEARRYATRTAPGTEVPVNHGLGWIASTMAALIAAAGSDIHAAAAAGIVQGRTAADRQFASDLQSYIDYLAPASDSRPELVLTRLLTLEVVQYATGTYRDIPDQFVELVQISANVPNVLGGPSTAAEKLAGAQLGNFGGFYKKAWRANDWMFGRMDGADRLVRVLLNPARLARLYANGKEMVLNALHEIAVPATADAATRTFLEQHWQRKEPLIAVELAFLEQTDIPVPEQLPHAVDAVVAKVHLDMMREELPEVVGAAIDDRRNGARKTGASADLVAAAERQIGGNGATAWKTLAPAELVRLFTTCRIGEERFAGEVGTDLFASTLTRSLAVATTMISGPRAGLGALGRVLQVVRLPMLIVDALAQNAVTQSRAAAFISGATVAVGGLIVALTLLTDASLPSWLVSVGSLVFVASVSLSLRRRPRLVIAWIMTALVVWGLVTILPELKQIVRGWFRF